MHLTHLLLAITTALAAEAAVAVANNNGWHHPPWFPRPRPRPGRPTLPTVPTTPTTPAPIPISQCAAGGAQCCNSVQRADNAQVVGLLGLLGAANVPATAQVGVTCECFSSSSTSSSSSSFLVSLST